MSDRIKEKCDKTYCETRVSYFEQICSNVHFHASLAVIALLVCNMTKMIIKESIPNTFNWYKLFHLVIEWSAPVWLAIND